MDRVEDFPIKDPAYLGDGAYVGLDPHTGDIVVYTTDGIHVTNRVVLDAFAVRRLLHWANGRV